MLKRFYQIIIFPYTLFLLYLMFLGMGRFQYEDNLVRLEPIFSTVWFIQNTILWRDIVKIVLGNIIMFIPFGFLGWIFSGLKEVKTLLYSFISAIVVVEAMQYFTRMGVFEVDDIILNTFGVYIGWNLKQYIERKL
ncbi:VanZ family protein [Chryseobacterium nematophagum]|uniref:VanZ family protein n=1 Tax=Chryseobacterium nematophagum TaxID=2305228 RepID=A0A3M7L8I2_9FLAO|nr:VanZ family protein [Chryseobacterium nematophagum]RMZ57859.1 VanZ family protein [Chryseobacterium nematophagum]RMZ59091.1 VanZ family protein [Chryseobacterium nematophagum]